VSSPEGYLLALWVHECRRVFADKLINQEDRSWVDKSISDLCRQEFPADLCKQVSASIRRKWQCNLLPSVSHDGRIGRCTVIVLHLSQDLWKDL
jgi:hypothetical protein